MTVQTWTTGSDDPEVTTLRMTGFLIEPLAQDLYTLNIPGAVVEDLIGLALDFYIDPVVGSCLWSTYIQVVEFDPLSISFGFGDPSPYKFGSLTHQLLNLVTSRHYINFQNQAFPRQGCMIIPTVYTGPPFDSDLIDQFEAFRMYNTIQPTGGAPGSGYHLQDFGRENGGLYGSNELRVKFQSSVVANICVAYYATIPINQTYSPTTYFFDF